MFIPKTNKLLKQNKLCVPRRKHRTKQRTQSYSSNTICFALFSIIFLKWRENISPSQYQYLADASLLQRSHPFFSYFLLKIKQTKIVPTGSKNKQLYKIVHHVTCACLYVCMYMYVCVYVDAFLTGDLLFAQQQKFTVVHYLQKPSSDLTVLSAGCSQLRLLLLLLL